MHFTDLPPELRRFPRNDYSYAHHRTLLAPGLDPTDVLLAAGARRASRAWAAAARTGSWSLVDARCFTLAVLDKVIQLNGHARHNVRNPWPGRGTVAEWRAMVGDVTGWVYDTACAAYPRPAPPLSSVRLAVGTAMEWFHLSGDCAQPYRVRDLPKIDVPSFCGQFYLPRQPRGTGINATKRPMAHLQLAPQ